jgi:hypothetical protein
MWFLKGIQAWNWDSQHWGSRHLPASLSGIPPRFRRAKSLCLEPLLNIEAWLLQQHMKRSPATDVLFFTVDRTHFGKSAKLNSPAVKWTIWTKFEWKNCEGVRNFAHDLQVGKACCGVLRIELVSPFILAPILRNGYFGHRSLWHVWYPPYRWYKDRDRERMRIEKKQPTRDFWVLGSRWGPSEQLIQCACQCTVRSNLTWGPKFRKVAIFYNSRSTLVKWTIWTRLWMSWATPVRNAHGTWRSSDIGLVCIDSQYIHTRLSGAVGSV